MKAEAMLPLRDIAAELRGESWRHVIFNYARMDGKVQIQFVRACIDGQLRFVNLACSALEPESHEGRLAIAIAAEAKWQACWPEFA